jgi:O-antigen/teichoic acid export membrane protein
MLGALSTTDEVGLYSAAVNVARVMTIILGSLTPITLPFVAELIAANRLDELSKIYRSLIFWIVSLTLPIFLMIMFAADEVMLLFGKEFEAGGIALMILAAGQLINAGTGPIGRFMDMAGKQDTNVLVMSMGLLANATFNFLFIPRLGGVGASIANSLSNTLIFAILAVLASRSLQRSLYPLALLRPAMIAVIAWTAGYLYLTAPIQSLSANVNNLAAAGVSVVVFGIGFLAFGLREEDREFIFTVYQRVRSMIT